MAKLNAEISRIRVKELIDTKCGGSQQKFADLCGISKISVSQYVNGVYAPGNVSAVKISRVFGVDPLWIMGEDVPMYKSTVNMTVEMTNYEECIFHKYRSLPPDKRKLVDDMVNALYEAERRTTP